MKVFNTQSLVFMYVVAVIVGLTAYAVVTSNPYTEILLTATTALMALAAKSFFDEAVENAKTTSEVKKIAAANGHGASIKAKIDEEQTEDINDIKKQLDAELGIK